MTCSAPDPDTLPSLPQPACTVLRPDTLAAPVIFASPHSGRYYPQHFLDMLNVPLLDLRRIEDAYIDELFQTAIDQGAMMIRANYPRAYVDLNRDARELDQTMFSNGLPRAAGMPTAHVRAGLGCFPRVAASGTDIYARPLRREEGAQRLTEIHDVYHAAIRAELKAQQLERPDVYLIDCHSMPSRQIGRHPLPDIILGDRYGSSCSAALVRVAEQALRQQNFTVARNAPYAGGYTTRLYGRPQRGVHVLQIEINRRLYLDEQDVEKSPCFYKVKAQLAALTQAILAFACDA